MSELGITLGAFIQVFDKDSRVLCVRQAYGAHAWTTPGGHIEPREDPVQAVVRELFEETGLTIIDPKFDALFWKSYANDAVFSFKANAPTIINLSVPNQEIEDAGFFPVESLPTPMSLNTKVRIEHCLTGDAKSGLIIFPKIDEYKFA